MTQPFILAPQLFRPYPIDGGTYLIAPEGLLLEALTLGAAATNMEIADPPEGHIALFAEQDTLRIRAVGYVQGAAANDSAATIAHEFWAVGAIPSTALIDVWLRVTAVTDLGTHFRYAVEQVAPGVGDQYWFPAQTLVMGYGPVDNRLLQLRATRDRTPQIDLFTTGATPWDGSTIQVRLGRLDDLAAIEDEQYGLAVGPNLDVTGGAHARVSEQGLHLSQLALTLDNGDQPTARLAGDGSLRLGPDVTEAEGADLAYDPTTRAVQIRDAQIGIARIEDARVSDLSISGGVTVGADADDPDSLDLVYQPATRIVQVRKAKVDDAEMVVATVETANLTAVDVSGNLTGQGEIVLKNGDVQTVQLTGQGDLRIGPDLAATDGPLFELQSGAGALAIAAITTMQGDVTFVGQTLFEQGLVSRGALRFEQNGVAKVKLDPTGDLRLGPNVADADGVDLSYDAAARRVHLREARIETARVADAEIIDLVVQGTMTAQGDIVLAPADRPVVRLGGNGNIRFGSDLSQPGAALFDLQSGAGTLAVRAATTFGGRTLFEDVAVMQGAALFQGRATLQGETVIGGDLTLEGATSVHNRVHLLDGGALVVGEAESIRVDDNGITMRLEPGENNAVKVLGIGRAAMLNAYQTPNNIQQFDILGYYSGGVPSLDGRLLLGVAGVNSGDPDLFVRMTRFVSGMRRMDVQASLVDIHSNNIQLTGATSVNGTFEFNGSASPERLFRLRNLPTSPDGLSDGAVWNNQGTLSIVR